MSADNYIAIWKGKDRKYRGFDLSASCSAPTKQPTWRPLFIAETAEKAILAAQDHYTEYGFKFMNLEDI